MVLELLKRNTRLEDVEAGTAGIIRAIRTWVVLHKAERSPFDPMVPHFGSAEATARLRVLIEMVGTAWPDAVALAPPCCRLLSHDEATLAALLAHARTGNRRGFDRECHEMLDWDARCRIWVAMRVLLGVAA